MIVNEKIGMYTEDEILEEEYMLGKEYYKKILEKASESKKDYD